MKSIVSSDHLYQFPTINTDPTLADLPVGTQQTFRNTGTGDLEHWGNNNGVIEKISSGSLYKVFSALLNQSGTNAPTATVLENTLNILPGHFTRTSPGNYVLTKTGAFPPSKTMYFISPQSQGVYFYTLDSGGGDSDNFYIFSSIGFIGNYSDNAMTNVPFEIRVYQ